METHGTKCRSRPACFAAGLMGTAVLAGLAACSGLFGTSAGLPTLYVGGVEVRGREGCVLASVVDMPGGGLGAIQLGKVGGEAIAFSDIDPASVEVEGVNGFVVLAEAFGPAGGAVIAANGADGVVGGDILRFTFTVTGDAPALVVTEARVVLATDEGEFVETWVVKTAEDAVYVAR